MSQSLAPTLKVQLTGTKTNAADLETAAVTLSKTIQFALTNGTSDNQVDLMWSDTRTLNAASDETLDLAGVLTDAAFGSVLTFAKVKAILIYSNSSSNKVLTVGGAASNAFETFVAAAGDAIKINPGGMLLLVAPNTGYTVTASTGDQLKIANASGGSSTYDIIILGTSA